MSSPVQTAITLLKVLGLSHIKHITEFSIKADCSGFPTATVTTTLIDKEFATAQQHFNIIALDEPTAQPLDIEAMAAAARMRVANHIDKVASSHSMAIRQWLDTRDDFVHFSLLSGDRIYTSRLAA